MSQDVQLVEVAERGERWPAFLLSEGYTNLSNIFLDFYDRLEITNCEAMFLLHLLRHKWTAESPYPSYAVIGTRMGLSARRVSALAQRLERLGYLKRIYRGPKQTNAFDLQPLFDALERKWRERRSRKLAESGHGQTRTENKSDAAPGMEATPQVVTL